MDKIIYEIFKVQSDFALVVWVSISFTLEIKKKNTFIVLRICFGCSKETWVKVFRINSYPMGESFQDYS